MKLAEALKIAQTPASPGAEVFRFFLACGILPLHLQTFLHALLSQRASGRAIQIQTGLYGDLLGNVKKIPASGVQFGVTVIEWPDLDPRLGLRRLGGWGPNVLPDIQTTVARNLRELLLLLEDVAQTVPVALCLPTIPLPPISYQPAEQFSPTILALEKALFDFALDAASIRNIRILNQQHLDVVSPIGERLDVKSELSTGFPYRTAHASKLAELLARLIHPGAAKKGLITDLDDTLWRGLLGEDGVEGISWELDRQSQIHALYQQLLGALAESGVMLAIASKNDPTLVAEALARPDLLLPADRFFPVEVNWNAKSRSVGRILEAWNVAADSVVFVDDNRMELAEIESVYPTIECLRFPVNDEQAAYQFLERLRELFGKPEIHEEDVIRIASIRGSTELRQNAQTESGQRDDFLAQTGAELTVGTIPSTGEARAFELLHKTNQFNLNGRRLNQAQFQMALNRTGAVSLLVSYDDKYGPLGKIAVLLGQVESSVLRIDTWVMSCRAFSRNIEFKCLEYLFETSNISTIELDFLPTPRNGVLKDFLSHFTDCEPTGSCRISRESFMNKKPVLYHKLIEANYG